MICTVPRLADIPATPLDPRWEALPRLAVASFHAKSSAHRPAVHVQLGHSGDHLHLRFTVQDRYVLSRATGFNAMVCNDSCVEFFFEPVPGLGYFNLEMSAGGTPLCYHITDARRAPGGFAAFVKLKADELGAIVIAGTLPRTVDPEIATPLDWALCARIPLAPFARRLGRALPVPGRWRGNFFKCADQSSHPHWGSWATIGEELNFHQPDRFGTIELL
jgi:hypothetical protein